MTARPGLYRQPLLGIVAFGVSFLSQWLGHGAYTLIHGEFGDWHYAGSFAVGLAGAVLVALSLRRADVPATWIAFLGAQFVWVGWFELTWEFYANFFGFPAFEAGPNLVSGGSANLLMATLPILLTILLVYGFYNRQTRCNLMRWFHRNLRLSPGMPTSDNGRSIGRIVAMETLFVIWFCYLFWLYVAYIAASETVMVAAYVGWAAWFAYIFAKLLRYPQVGPAFRYAIPVGVVGWGLMEMPSNMGFYDEVWLKPYDYPLTTVVVVALYVAGLVYLANPPARLRAEAEPVGAA